jgi:putative ABC transport system substrate-binding protein
MIRPTRRQLLFAAGAAAALGPARLHAQSDGRFRIAMVLPRGVDAPAQGFMDYLERQGLAADYLIFDLREPDMPVSNAVARIKAERPDLVYTWGTPTTLAVTGRWDAADPAIHVTDIPVVFTTVSAPEASGVVESLERPGRNVTGVSHIPPLETQINTITAYRRQVERIGVVFNPQEPNSRLNVAALQAYLPSRGIALIDRQVPAGPDGAPDGEAIPGLVAEIAAAEADFLYIGPDTFVAVHNRDPLTIAAMEARLPTFAATESIVRRSHALLGLFSSALGVGRFAGFKAEQILLEGRAPGAIPVETLRRFSLLINMAVARRIEAYPPLSLLNLAEIIRA